MADGGQNTQNHKIYIKREVPSDVNDTDVDGYGYRVWLVSTGTDFEVNPDMTCDVQIGSRCLTFGQALQEQMTRDKNAGGQVELKVVNVLTDIRTTLENLGETRSDERYRSLTLNRLFGSLTQTFNPDTHLFGQNPTSLEAYTYALVKWVFKDEDVDYNIDRHTFYIDWPAKYGNYIPSIRQEWIDLYERCLAEEQLDREDIEDITPLTINYTQRDIPQRGHEKFKAFLGGNVIPDDDKNFLSLSTIKMHPRFNPGTLDNDLALIRLTTPVKFSNSIKPICLSQAGSPFIGQKATVIGWGWTHDDTEADNLLREVEVEVIRNSKCQESYDKIGIKITQSMMCASLPGKDSCKGDSGGPMSIVSDGRSSSSDSETESGRHNLVGVVSFGQRCASPTYPGIYTAIKKLTSWIKANTRDAIKCAS